MNARRSLSERLSTVRAVIGLQQTHPNPALSEMAGMCGYDFVMLDAEHGVFSEHDYLHALHALAAVDVLALVRLAKHDTYAVGRYMDIGVDGIVVPNVVTAEQARTMLRAMEYPRVGTRGFGASLHRGTRYGKDLEAYLKAPRAGVSLVVIIESTLGVENCEEILAVDGVDAVLIGCSDLSASLGRPRDYSQPGYAEALARVERAALAQGKILGTAPHAGHRVEDLIARGHRLLLISADMSIIRDGMTSEVQKARSCF